MPKPSASNSNPEPDFLTTKAAQQYLAVRGIGLSIFALCDYCRKGKFSAKRVGVSWYIRRESLEEFLKG